MQYQCINCGKTFRPDKTQYFNSQFCDRKCFVEHFSSKSIAKNKKRIQNEVMLRDGNRCTACGRNDVFLCVHHKDESQKKGKWFSANNDPSNLITLCPYCHAEIHKGEDIVRRRIKEILKMRKNKYTYAQIGKLCGVSQQRIHQICFNRQH